jgi:DNA invertase Pin-like site-specific DNA recombinase
MREFIAYRRVTTAEERRSPGALETQALAILQFVQSEQGVLLRDFLEREPGRGSDALERRAQLQRAMQLAKERQAVLVVSTLDRLSRDVATLSRLVESGLEFVAAETPTADAFMLQIYAEVVQRSREHIARRISSTLQAKKRTALAQGQPNPLGNAATLQPHNLKRRVSAEAFAARLEPTLNGYRKAGMTQRRMVEELNLQGVKTAEGGTWSLMQLQRVLARIPPLA